MRKEAVRLAVVAAAVFAVTCVAPPLSLAQTNIEKQRGTLTGTLVDESGKPVEGIAVLISTHADMSDAMEVKSTSRGFLFPRLGSDILDYYIRIKSDEWFIHKISIQTRRLSGEIFQQIDAATYPPGVENKLPGIQYRLGGVKIDLVLGKLADYKAAQEKVLEQEQLKKEVSLDKKLQDMIAVEDYKGAAALLAKSIEENPVDAQRHWDRALILAKAGERAEAVKEGRKTIALKPDMKTVRVKVAQWVAEDGGTDEAIALLEKEQELDPQNPAVYHYLSAYYREAGRKEDEERAVAKWSELAPDDSEALLMLAGIKAGKGDYPGAEQIFRKVAEKDPANAYKRFYDVGATIFNARGDVNSAITALKKSIELKPDFPPPYKLLGDCLVNQNKLAEARAQYEKFIQLAPHDPEAADLKGIVQSLPKK